MSTYEPGDVAVATVRGVPNVRIVRGEDHWAVAADTDDFFTDRNSERCVTDIRPLVVLDLDLAAHIGVDALVADLRTSGFYDIADQIEAQTKPAKPAEPTGLGAVVEDAEGRKWVLPGGPIDGDEVWYSPADNYRLAYARIDAVRVLSEGVA